jgi:hypothetical protein
MIDTLRKLYIDKPLLKKMARKARMAAVEEYNWANQVERMGEFVGSLCNR